MANIALKSVLDLDFSNFQKGLQSSAGLLANFNKKISDVGKQATLKLTVPIAGAGLAAVTTAGQFEKSMSQIQGLVGATDKEINDLSESVLGLSGRVAKSPNELAKALFSLKSAGLDSAEALDALERAGKASAGGLGDTQAIALTVAGAMNSYAESNMTAVEATDILVATVREGNLAAEDLAGSLASVLPVASEAGVGLEEVGAAVALITRTGLSASESITQVRSAILAMNAPTEEAKKVLEEAGISADQLQKTLAEDGLIAALRLVEKAAAGDTSQFRKMLGSVEALSGAQTLLNGDARETARVFNSLANATGSTDQAFEAAQKTIGFKFNRVMQQAQAISIRFGSQLLDVAGTFLELISVVQNFVGLIPDEFITIGLMAGGLLAALGPVLMIFGKLLAVYSALALKGLVLANAKRVMTTATTRLSASLMPLLLAIEQLARRLGITTISAMSMKNGIDQMAASSSRAAGAIGLTGTAATIAGRGMMIAAAGAKALAVGFAALNVVLLTVTVGFMAFKALQWAFKKENRFTEEQLAQTTEIMRRYGESSADVIERVQGLVDAHAELNPAVNDARDAIEDMATRSARDFIAAQTVMERGLTDLTGALSDAGVEFDDLARVSTRDLRIIAGEFEQSGKATGELVNGLQDLSAEGEDLMRVLLRLNEEGFEKREIREYVRAVIDAGAVVAEVTAAEQEHAEALLNSAETLTFVADKFGLSTAQATLFVEALDGVSDGDYVKGIRSLDKALTDFDTEMVIANDGLESFHRSTREVTRASRDMQYGMGDLESVVHDLRIAEEELNAAYAERIESTLSLIEKQQRYRRLLMDLGGDVNNFVDGFEEFTEVGEDNIDMFTRLIDEVLKMEDAGTPFHEAFETMIQDLKDHNQLTDEAEQALRDYAIAQGILEPIPEEVILEPIALAVGAIDGLTEKLNGLSGRNFGFNVVMGTRIRTVAGQNLTIDDLESWAVDTHRAMAEAIRRQGDIPIAIVPVPTGDGGGGGGGTTPPAFYQTGGAIPGGRATGTMITAHGGEYVLSADVVDAIRRGGPSAGLGGRATSPARSGAVFNVTVNAGMGTDGAMVGRKIVDVIRRFERSSSDTWRS